MIKQDFWKYKKKGFWLSITILSLLFVTSIDPASAQTYVNSAHGNSSTGIERSSLGVSAAGGAGFAIGNCIHCHEQHASVRGLEPVPDNTGPDVYLGFDVEEELCYGCHGTGNYEPGTRPVRDVIQTDTAKTYAHDPSIAQYFHRANETAVDAVDAAAHVECTDCHNPHKARTENSGVAGPRAKGSNAIGADSPLLGVTGVEFTTYPTGWTTNLTTWSAAPGGNYTFLNDNPSGEGFADKEYQICFKCHSSFSGNTDSWDGAASGALAWTDVALEFNPDNVSYHPVVDTLNNGAFVLAPKGLNANQLLAPWNANPGDNLMYCSDCHASNDAATTDRYGPHGSTTKWMLTGTYQNWPFQTVANNGSSVATNWATLNGLATERETFCMNCHPNPGDAGNSTIVHEEHIGRNNTNCVTCHIRVPHGGSVSRLMAAVVTTTNLPDRYWPDGNGGGFTPYVEQFVKTTYQAYDSGGGNCNTRTCATGRHNLGSGESW